MREYFDFDRRHLDFADALALDYVACSSGGIAVADDLAGYVLVFVRGGGVFPGCGGVCATVDDGAAICERDFLFCLEHSRGVSALVAAESHGVFFRNGERDFYQGGAAVDGDVELLFWDWGGLLFRGLRGVPPAEAEFFGCVVRGKESSVEGVISAKSFGEEIFKIRKLWN